MFAAPSKDTAHDGAARTCAKDTTRPGSKVKKKSRSPEVTLPPLCREIPSLSAAFMARPLFSATPILRGVSSARPLSLVELPHLIAQVGPERAIRDTKWTEGPRLMASALGTDIPIRAVDELAAQSLPEKDESIKVTMCKNKKTTAVSVGKATKPNKAPLTGTEVVHIFARKRDLGELELYYLKEVDNNSYRPYHLQVVSSSEAGSDYYIFSPNTVLHVTEKGYGGLVSLAEWHRESLLWTALQEIHFFRDFRLQKAFTWWQRRVRKMSFQHKCESLQDMLIIAVPQFRNAVFLFTRIIEELNGAHRLPQEGSKTYTLLEFKTVLITMNQECVEILKRFAHCRAAILNRVKEDCYREQQELQLHMEYTKKPNKCYEPIHLHLAHQQELKKKLELSERVLQKLGNFAALTNQMVVQSLVTIIRQDVISFLNNVLKRKTSQQCCLFQTELCVSANSRLTVDPPTHLFQEAVSEALLTAGDSMIQMCDSCGLFLETNYSVFSSQDLTSDVIGIDPIITAEDKNNDGMTGHRKSCRWRLLRDPSPAWLLLPKQTLMVQGNRMHVCYYPLPKSQLESQIRMNDVAKGVEEEQARIMQEAELEIQQLCERHSWLVDIHLFVSQWGQASLKGQPALLYEEHIQKVRHWIKIIHTVPSSVSTSNQLFIIQGTRIKENLGQHLRIIEEEVRELLAEQIKQRSESLISDLERATAGLKTEPTDLHELSKYTFLVRESVKMLAEAEERLEYIHSLQDTISMNYRNMTEQEVTLEGKIQAIWDCFIPFLKQADRFVCHRLPAVDSALGTMSSFLVRDLKNLISKATSGPFLDPAQNAQEMVSALNLLCAHVHHLNAKLERLCMNSQNLQEHPMDYHSLTSDVQKVKARKELWELIAEYTSWMDEWKQQRFREVVVSQAQERIAKWKDQALSLTSVIPTHDAVLQETVGILDSLSHHLAVVAKLQSPTLKHKHWKDMGLLGVLERKVTVAELMSQQVNIDEELIIKICKDAQAEHEMEQALQKLQRGWKARLFQLDIFSLPAWQQCELQHGLTVTEKPTEGTVSNPQAASQHSCNDVRFTVTGLEIHFAEIENDLMTLSAMLKSPHSVQCRLQMEEFVHSLQDLGKLLHLFERYQHMWAFLTKMFHETSFSVQRRDLLEQFQLVDETFKEIMNSISSDPRVLNFIRFKKTNERFHSNSLYQVFIDGLSTMEAISSQMVDILDTLCEQFPRLWFLSDREMIQLLSFNPTPFTLQPFVRKCFKGVRWLEVHCEVPSDARDVKRCRATSENRRQMKVLGVFGSLQEHIIFLSPLEPPLNTLVWLSTFEKQLKLTMVQLMKQCAVVRSQLEPSSQDPACEKKVGDTRRKTVLPALDLLSEYPLQCLLVAEEAVWCKVVLQAFQESDPVKLGNIKAHNSETLKSLGRSIRDGAYGAKSESLVSKYTIMCLSALVQLAMKHAHQLSRLMAVQSVPLESSFEWLSLMKYHINSEDRRRKGNDDTTCFVDVLGHRLQYDYEYFDSKDLVMVHTPSTDRATLGILLALTSYRCGFVMGPCMSGKTTTVAQLGKALGRQMVTIQCTPSMRASVVQRILLGALQTGAWLLMDSVDLLTQGVLSLLGQHLLHIHQSFSELPRQMRGRVNEEPEARTDGGVTGCKNVVDSECHMVLAGKSISASLNYGCVLISSRGYTSEVPQSLRCATRPVALTHPDYRIIAEVMLTSIGFLEAMSLSRHLVSLISLAKDSLCLPDFITDEQSCYLVVLQKIISASEIHLQQSVRQREAKASAAEQTDVSSQIANARAEDVDRKESEKPSRMCSTHLSVIQGLMEETAIVKGILSVLLPALCEHKKASQFYAIFKDTFPIACQIPLFQQHIEEEEKNQIKDAFTKELQRTWSHFDPEIISRGLTLYQTIKFSQAVMLVGPSGSGKTTCYSALAEALNCLAAKAAEHECENDNTIEGNNPQAKKSGTNWNSVDIMVLFPNAMSHEEMFGCFCEKRGWQDGAVAKVLRDSGRHEPTHPTICNKNSNQAPIVKWLVMDGNPVGEPGWLDYMTTLFSTEDPFLCLSSGETLPSQSHLKLFMEVTELRDASPSAVTRCSLVYFTGTDLWKSVWKSEMDAVSFEHKLDQETLKMWNRLAEDIFSSTLSLLKQKDLTSAIHTGVDSFKDHTYGLQEIMSFVRILRALLLHYGREMETAQVDERDAPPHRSGIAGSDSHTKQYLLARNLFLIAYIWGFSGHLHPRHWPQFDLLVRQVLFSCRYKIVVPDEESVLDHFFCIDSKMYPKSTLTHFLTPKYGKCPYLLNLMLEANQPVLLAGEPGSEKNSLCKTLLSFAKPHISLPASPLLGSGALRTILNNISCQKRNEGTVKPKQPGLLLFMDDLHEAPCDVFGKTSAALETLRQSVSKGEILTFDNYHFKSLSSAHISYMATCVFGSGSHRSNVISSRLSRLFSIFVLPSLSMDVILSIYSPRLKIWLRQMPLKESGGDMACCIIAATKSLYHAVRDQFQPTVQRPHFIFSHHDIQRVFSGMYLWQPSIPNTGTVQEKEDSLAGFPPVPSGPTALVADVVRLWMHECMRTFSDRLCSEDESKTLVSLIAKTATVHYGTALVDETQPVNLDEPSTVTSHDIHTDSPGSCKPIGQSLDTENPLQEAKPAVQSAPETGHTSSEPSLPSENYRSKESSLKTHPVQPLILQHMESIMSTLTYGPDLSEALNAMNQKHNNKCSGSYRGQDIDVLQQDVCALIDRNDYGITTRYFVHRQRASQLLHILRALLIPGGHGVLIGSDGGTGRKTTVRLAAYVTGYQLMEVHPGNEYKLHEILKEAGDQTRVDGVNVIVLVHEEISQSVREALLVAMDHKTCPGLYSDEELRNLVSRVTSLKDSRRYLMDSWMFEKHMSQIHRNVHVFLLLPFTMTDSRETPTNCGTDGRTAQLTKAMSLSCCVEVYQPWSNPSLVDVAAQCLKTSAHKMAGGPSEASLSVAMAGIHQSACQYASVLLRAQAFSPQTYTEFIAHFGFLCCHLHEQQQSQANRVASVLSHLDVMNNRAVQHKQHLIRLREKVAEAQQHEKDLLTAVECQKSLIEEAEDTCTAAENEVYNLEEQINHAEMQLRPVFLSALKILNCLNPSDLEEVRHYRDPPDGVVKVLDAICLLFNCPPGWESAKQLLSQDNFFQDLEFFDRHILTNEQLQQLGEIVHSPQFVPESVREVSKACESLCRWVQAVYEGCCMQHHLLVKQQLDVLVKEARSRLHLAKREEDDALERLEDIKLQLHLAQKHLEERLLELHTAASTEREVITAAEQLEAHVKGWQAAAQEAEVSNQTLPGDALILAAAISYLGPFGPDTRTELLSKWRELCRTGRININPEDPRTSLFTHSDTVSSQPLLGFPVLVSERLQLPLGLASGTLQDAPSARMIVKLLLWGCRSVWVQRWPLLADTQQHLDISSQSWFITGESAKLEKEAECGMVVSADDPELLDKLDQAAEKGLRVLVTHMERAIPNPQFLDRLTRSAGCCLPGLKQHAQPTHPEFCLFLSTHLPVQLLNSEIHPSILAQVRVVDLSLSSEEIQELMLTQLLQSESKKLLIRHVQLQNDKQLLQKKLVTEKEAVMDYILHANTSELQDSDVLSHMNVCHEETNKLQAEMQRLSEELEYHESLLAVPRKVLKLAAALYQALQEVSRLSPAYYFSLRGFIIVMQKALIVEGRPLVSHAIGKVPQCVIPEVTNQMVSQLLVHYRPCLIKSHFAVLKLLLSAALLQHNQLCSEAERLAFLKGLQDIEHPDTKIKPCSSLFSTSALPSWISPDIHPELLCLDKIPVFRGLTASLSAFPTQWQEYLHFPSSTVAGGVPCRSHSHLSLIQRAILWKTMLPTCLEGLAGAMAAHPLCLPGQTAGTEAPHTGNPEALSRYLVKHDGPVICTLPREKWINVQPLHLINKLAKTKEVQVKVISFGALCDRELILSMLDKAVKDGHWLVFNNCHLLEQWDDKVVAHLSQLVSSPRGGQSLFHPCFRLWFITQEYAPCSIPGAVRMCALPLVCDSPWYLEEELIFSMQQVESVIQRHSLWGVTAGDVELLLRCAVFHCVLLQRQTYKYLGQGRIYNWSHEDLLALMDAHIFTASRCCDKTEALQYLAVNLVHGGHVLDTADLEVVQSVAKTCLSRESPLWASAPHILSNIISNAGHFDLSGLLEIVDRGLQDAADINDPLVLGFNTDVAAEMIKIRSQNLNVLLQASQTPEGTVRRCCTQMKQPADSYGRLQALKSYLSQKNDSPVTNAGAASHSPLRDFLQAEWDDLIDLVSSLLSQLQQPVQYNMSTFAPLLELRDLSSLEKRAELLGAYLWQHDTSDPPGAYRLSAFKNAKGFLVAVMREAAAVNHKNISDIALNFQVLSDSPNAASLPLEAVYLCGLELRGASWDTQLGALQDTVCPQPHLMPLVCLNAQIRSTVTVFPCQSSHLKDTSDVSPPSGPQLPLYHCPLYLTGEWESGNWGLAEVNIVTRVPLHAELSPALCSLRRVRLVSLL